MKTFLIALLSILFSVTAQFALKHGMAIESARAFSAQPFGVRPLFAILTNAYVFGGFVLYGLGAIVWLAVLNKWDVSKAYPLVGLGFVLTAIVGASLGEQVTAARLSGIALICVGVLLVAQS